LSLQKLKASEYNLILLSVYHDFCVYEKGLNTRKWISRYQRCSCTDGESDFSNSWHCLRSSWM